MLTNHKEKRRDRNGDMEKQLRKIEKPGLFQKYQKYIKKYGYYVLPIHFLTSAFWLFLIHTMINSDSKISKYMQKWTKNDPQLNLRGNVTKEMALVFAIYKLISPLRVGSTILITHNVIKLLKKK